MKKNIITDYFQDIEITKEYSGYFYSIADAITIIILGSVCGLKNISQIHQWASNKNIKEFLKESFGIEKVPCYYWLLCLLKMVKPESLNKCFMNWVKSLIPRNETKMTVAIDGKTVCSTAKMEKYKNPLHIISAQLSELGLTFAQNSTEDKSNEIPAVRDLLKLMKLTGCVIVADALNCQKETAALIVDEGADYLLCVKDNQQNLKKDIEDYVQDIELREKMDTFQKSEKSRDRIEKRTAYITEDVDWLSSKEEWKDLKSIGAIHTEFETKKGKTSEWHYYITSDKLTAEELLHHARMEWSVETMHWLLDVHYEEDWCRVIDKNVQQNLNMLRKLSINLIKLYKERHASKRAISKIMFDCLLDCSLIMDLLDIEN